MRADAEGYARGAGNNFLVHGMYTERARRDEIDEPCVGVSVNVFRWSSLSPGINVSTWSDEQCSGHSRSPDTSNTRQYLGGQLAGKSCFKTWFISNP
jgi:hypothetical protein